MTVTPASELVHSACVIRNYEDGNGWVFIDDASHKPINVTSISTDKWRISIYRDMVEDAGTVIATVDNNLAELGYRVGASGGGQNTNLVIYGPNGTAVDHEKFGIGNVPNSNIWLHWVSTPLQPEV